MRAELCHFSGLKIYPGHGCSQSEMTANKSDFSVPRPRLFITTRKTHVSFDGLSSIDVKIRRVSATKLHSNDVSDATSKPQRPSLVCLTTNFWPRSNKSQRSVKSNETTQSRPPRKRKRLLKQTRQLPERQCQKQHPNNPLKCP